jgi:hypothetical protein
MRIIVGIAFAVGSVVLGAAVFGGKLPANRNRCPHPRHHHMRKRHPLFTGGRMNPRHIREPTHTHPHHPQTHNIPQTHNMKTEEDEGFVKKIRRLTMGGV